MATILQMKQTAFPLSADSPRQLGNYDIITTHQRLKGSIRGGPTSNQAAYLLSEAARWIINEVDMDSASLRGTIHAIFVAVGLRGNDSDS